MPQMPLTLTSWGRRGAMASAELRMYGSASLLHLAVPQ